MRSGPPRAIGLTGLLAVLTTAMPVHAAQHEAGAETPPPLPGSATPAAPADAPPALPGSGPPPLPGDSPPPLPNDAPVQQDGPPPVPENDTPPTPPPVVNDPVTPPPPPPEATATKFFILVNGAQAGPYTVAELKALVASGRLTAMTFVWRDGMAQWVEAAQVPELADLVRDTGPPKLEFDVTKFLLGTWQVDQATIDMGGGQKGRLRGQYYYEPSAANFNGVIDTVFQGQPIQIGVTSSGYFQVTKVGADKLKVTRSWFVEYHFPGGYFDFNTINAPFTLQIVDENTVTEVGTDTTWRRVSR